MTHRTIPARSPCLAALLLLAAGCGSGGDAPPPVTLTITSTAALDGFVTGPQVSSTGPASIVVGDTSANTGVRGFLRFSLASVPPGATVVTATLTIHQFSVTGVPFALGVLTADHLLLGAALDTSDYASAALAVDVGTLSDSATLGFKTLDVTAQVAADLAAARANSDFRLHFTTETEGDGSDDLVQFNDAENGLGSGDLPTLTVTVQP